MAATKGSLNAVQAKTRTLNTVQAKTPVVMQEGLAHICLITSSMTHVRQKVEQSIPRKGKAAIFGHDKAVSSFYEKTFHPGGLPSDGAASSRGL